jgi:hypothetical protein
MEAHWRPDLGWSVPNADVYPWGFLWDSCFHALVWDALGDERADRELASVFAAQTASGFVPHMNYAAEPAASTGFWGVAGASTITQPPMYGHAIAVLHRHGRDVGAASDAALRALRHLFEVRRAPCGLLRIFHPWESGVDDHPRWAVWQPDPWDRVGWRVAKGRLVRAMRVEDGEAVASPAFDVCPAGFNALVAWNAWQLAAVTGDDRLRRDADDLAAVLDTRWDPQAATWSDVAADGTPGSAIRTLDALLPALVTADDGRARTALAAAVDPDHFGLPFGPSGVDVAEPAFDPAGYGRGSAWPHLTYLLWVAALRLGLTTVAADLAGRLVGGAEVSGLSEHWDPRDGAGLGARPQSWTGLAVVVSESI